ncbi:MAG: LLM class flavin-dependent oxidoreductase, partial [Acidimicrobiia bacterium]
QVRWFGGMVGNHVHDMVKRYGTGDESKVPKVLADYIEAREGYDYVHHGKASNTSTDFVPDEIVDRFCLLGPPEAHIARLEELRSLGVDQFAIYLMHDDREGTLEAYGTEVIPRFS